MPAEKRKRRNTTSTIPITRAPEFLRKVVRSAAASLTKKLARLQPAGSARFVLVCSALGDREMFRVVGDEAYVRVMEPHLAQFAEVDRAAAAVEHPDTAERRAKACRHMLAEAWAAHVAGTPWAGKRQMYKCVAGGAPVFGWWADVAKVPFTNTAVDDAGVSERVYRYLCQQRQQKEI